MLWSRIRISRCRLTFTLCSSVLTVLLCVIICMLWLILSNKDTSHDYVQIYIEAPATVKKSIFKRSNESEVTLPVKSPTRHSHKLEEDVTVVTAYFNIGSFPKGLTATFTPSLYRRWIAIFSKIRNPVVAFFDAQESVDHFRVVRSSFPENLTRIVLIDRRDLWAFRLESQIEEIFSQTSYPQHLPNTVVAKYSCAMHAKYELMRRVTMENFYRTRYISWLDVGLFRSLLDLSGNPVEQPTAAFQITVPPNFTRNAVAYGQVQEINMRLKFARDIVGFNAVWVCGCFFIGQMNIMFDWTHEYIKAVEDMLAISWMSTDQQVLYWMRTNGKIKTQLQVYETNNVEDYFHLGYLCRRVVNDNS